MVMEMHKRHKAILPSLNLKNKEWALKPQTLERPHLNKTATLAYAVEPNVAVFSTEALSSVEGAQFNFYLRQ